jgi:hypothetical protein
VTDGTGWQPPSDPGAQPGPSPYGAPAGGTPPQQPGGQWAQYGAPQPQPGVWAPPPKPGLIPLRPLSFGTILGSSFRVIRRNPAPTFGLSVLLYGFITIVYVAVLGTVLALLVSRVNSATSSTDSQTILAGSIGLIALTALIPVGLTVIAGGILQGIISLEVSRATLGEKLRIRGLWRLARGRFGALIGWSLLLTGALMVYIVIAALVLGVAIGIAGASSASSSSNSSIGAFVGVVFLAFILGLLFAAVASWIGTKLSLVPSAIMLERLTMREAMARSWQLTNGNFWRTFGTQLLISFIVSAASQIVTTPISLIGGIVLGLTNPTGDVTSSIASIVVLYVVIGIVTVVVGAVGLVTQTSALTLIYIDIRMRKEGLDLELLHFMEAKHAGTAGVDNPYLRDVVGSMPPAAPTGSPWG